MTPTRLLIARHAPLASPGLAGRRDADADCSDTAGLDWLRARLTGLPLLSSPARRCRQTCAAMGLTPQFHTALWEQDFGRWELDGFPDLGPLPLSDLAAHRPAGGESFLDMAARVQPLLQSLNAATAILAHAGTVRAALAMVVGPCALSFSVAPLSLTVLSRAGNDWSVEAVNRVAP